MRKKLLYFVTMACASICVSLAPRARAGQPQALFYELRPESSYTHGCFEPCLCPIFTAAGMTGAFSLVLVRSDGLFDEYAVSGIDWTAPLDPPLRITGSGTYRIGGEVAILQELVLDLSLDGDPPVRFQSGLVPGGGGFPESLEVEVAMGQKVCLDTVLGILAARSAPRPVEFRRADCNADGSVDISDAVSGLLFLFAGGDRPPCTDACDSNDDGRLDLSDAVYTLGHLFLGGAPPPAPFDACGADGTDDALDCGAFPPCVKACEDEVAAIARETAIVGSSSGVVRLDYLSRRILGWQLLIGKYSKVDEAAARATSEADTGYGAQGRMLNPPDPVDAYVFYEPPGDFGGAGVVSARTGLSLFGGGIVWDGAGDITYPEAWRPAASLGSGCAPLSGEVSARGYDLAAGQDLSAEDVKAALDVVRGTALPEGMATSGYVFDAVVLLYPRSVGVFDPFTAEWIVILNGGWLE